jgi:hypothetical protein
MVDMLPIPKNRLLTVVMRRMGLLRGVVDESKFAVFEESSFCSLGHYNKN